MKKIFVMMEVKSMVKIHDKEYTEEEEKELKIRIMDKITELLKEELDIEVSSIQSMPLISLAFIIDEKKKKDEPTEKKEGLNSILGSYSFGALGWFPGDLVKHCLTEYGQAIALTKLSEGFSNLKEEDVEYIKKEIEKMERTEKINDDPMYQ